MSTTKLDRKPRHAHPDTDVDGDSAYRARRIFLAALHSSREGRVEDGPVTKNEVERALELATVAARRGVCEPRDLPFALRYLISARGDDLPSFDPEAKTAIALFVDGTLEATAIDIVVRPGPDRPFGVAVGTSVVRGSGRAVLLPS